MTKLDRLIKEHKRRQKDDPYMHERKLSADTALALAELQAVVVAAKNAVEAGAIDEIHLSLVRDRITTAAKWLAEEAQEKKRDE